MQPFIDIVTTTISNLVIVGLPFFIYFAFQKWRKKRSFKDIAQGVGLQLCAVKYIGYSALAALVLVAYFVIWQPSVELFTGDTSPQRHFVGLGFGATSLTMALLYGVVATGFCEELLFRGMIAGSLSRRLPLVWANLIQAGIFLLPHLLVPLAKPELWPILIPVFAGGLLAGWLRIKSGSILGPWLIHATANISTCLHVAIQTAAT